jgi:hypothetical protein
MTQMKANDASLSLQACAEEHTLSPRRTSLQTASTTSTTGAESAARIDKMVETKSTAKSHHKSSKRRKNKRGNKEGREKLMDMVAQEMTMASWNEKQEDELDLPVANDPQTLADIFYAQMNGEAINTTPAVNKHYENTGHGEDEAEDIDYSDTGSFHHAMLDIPQFEEAFSPPASVSSKKKEKSSRQAVSSQKKGSSSSRSLTSKSNTSSNSIPSSNSIQGTLSQFTGSGCSCDSDELSMEEIHKYVMEHIPKSVKDKIPQEAWGQIFGDAIAKSKKKTPIVLDELPQEEDVSTSPKDTGDDDMSDISEMTEFNALQGAPSNHQVAPKAPEVTDDAFGPDIGLPSQEPSNGNLKSASLAVDSAIRPRNTVSFNIVQVRYYERVIDNNPACTSGAPIGIGWRYKKGGKMLVDEWEIQRGEIRKGNQMVLPRHVRDNLLRELGYAQSDIADATRTALKAKNQRKQTVNSLGVAGAEEAVEKATRGIRSILHFGKKSGLIKKQ